MTFDDEDDEGTPVAHKRQKLLSLGIFVFFFFSLFFCSSKLKSLGIVCVSVCVPLSLSLSLFVHVRDAAQKRQKLLSLSLRAGNDSGVT